MRRRLLLRKGDLEALSSRAQVAPGDGEPGLEGGPKIAGDGEVESTRSVAVPQVVHPFGELFLEGGARAVAGPVEGQ